MLLPNKRAIMDPKSSFTTVQRLVLTDPLSLKLTRIEWFY